VAARQRKPKVRPVVSPLWTALFVTVITYLLLYPWLDQIPVLHHLGVNEPYNAIILAYTSQPVRLVLSLFLIFYFLPDQIVRWLRTSRPYQFVLRSFKYRLAPLLSAAGILILALMLSNHYLFNLLDGFGTFCTDTVVDKLKTVNNGEEFGFDFDSSPERLDYLCVPTGLSLKTDTRYRIVISREPDLPTNPSGKWTWWGEESYMGGQPIAQMSRWKATAMAIMFPLRRTLDKPWGNIILRIGSKGNEENFLNHAAPAQVEEIAPYPERLLFLRILKYWPTPITPRRNGELFVYLNRPFPVSQGWGSWLSRRIPNSGKARIVIDLAPR